MEPNPSPQVESKSIFTSRTFLGLVIVVLPIILDWFGVQMSDADMQSTALELCGVVGSMVALWGRFKANRPVHVTPKSSEIGKTARPDEETWLMLAIAAGAALIFTSCAAGGGTRHVESLEGNASAQFDPVTGGYNGSVGGRIYFRDGRDAKEVKPLGLRSGVLDWSTDLGGAVAAPFVLDVETMDARTERLVIAPDGVALIVARDEAGKDARTTAEGDAR